jgi:ketosteroid isomerase-like protein
VTPGQLVLEQLRRSDSGDFEAFRAALDPDIEWVNPMAPAHGPDQVVEAVAAWAEPFPERRHDLTQVIEAGDLVALEGVWVATHTGTLRAPAGDVPATGRTARVPFAAVMRVRDGRLASVRVYLDPLGFMAQLGLAPEPAAAA